MTWFNEKYFMSQDFGINKYYIWKKIKMLSDAKYLRKFIMDLKTKN